MVRLFFFGVPLSTILLSHVYGCLRFVVSCGKIDGTKMMDFEKHYEKITNSFAWKLLDGITCQTYQLAKENPNLLDSCSIAIPVFSGEFPGSTPCRIPTSFPEFRIFRPEWNA